MKQWLSFLLCGPGSALRPHDPWRGNSSPWCANLKHTLPTHLLDFQNVTSEHPVEWQAGKPEIYPGIC